MAILKTCKISFYVLENKINDFMEFLHKNEIIEPEKGKGIVPERILQKMDSSVKNADRAIAAMNKYKPAKKELFAKRHNASWDDYNLDSRQTRAAANIIGEVLRLESCIENNTTAIKSANDEIKRLTPYTELDVPAGMQETEHCIGIAGKCRRITEEDIYALAREYGILIYNSIFNRIGSECYVFFLYMKRDEEKVRELFEKIGFNRAENFPVSVTPSERIQHLRKKTAALEKSSDECIEKIKKLAKNRRMIELHSDRLLLKREKYDALSGLENTEKVFIITGFVLEKDAERLIRQAESLFGAAAEFAELGEEEQSPVAFENNMFVSPVEDITANYAMPSENDIDPNPIMAVFYYWFFGMMFSDAGYGILMMLVCGILGFGNALEESKRKMLKMFFWCGVSTTLWGIAYGSFFGDLIKTVSQTFGNGNADFKPILIDPVNEALRLLIIAVSFGMIHILTALGIKFYLRWKNGDRRGAVYDVGFWITVLAGVSAAAAGAGLGFERLKNLGLVLSIFGVIGIVLTGGRDKKNPIMRLLSGIMSLYDITGFVGDILSYSRLMALGLATGVIASVVNVLASLGGNSPVGAVSFVLIELVGHALNFSINMLGAYVHTNRLQYVEFYQKFYEGGGKKFRPFSMNTKYYNFTKNRG